MAASSNNNIALAIYSELKDKDKKEQALIFPKIVQFLAKKKLLSKSTDILGRLDKIINEEEGRVVARVSSKGNLGEKIKHELKHFLLKRYRAKEADLVLAPDEKLLGGFRIEVGDEVIDLSVRNKIDKLQEYLTQSI